MNQIDRDYINLKTAKLLKKKGFRLYCRASYWKEKLILETPGYVTNPVEGKNKFKNALK